MDTRPNGKAGAGATSALRMPRRTIDMQLEGDYEGFWLEMWANPPIKDFLEIQGTNDFSVMKDRIKTLILDWNFVDFDGNPIPLGEIEELSVDLIGIIINTYLEKVGQSAEVPKA